MSLPLLLTPLLLVFAPGLDLAPQDPAPEPGAAAPADTFAPDPAWKPLGKDLWFDPAQRQLVVRARVCLREGYLEHFLCSKNTKEHESILATEAPPRLLNAGLILVAGDPGHPVRYRPEFQAPAGPKVRLELEWLAQGKPQRSDARAWVKDEKSGKPLDVDWVFAGSEMYSDPETKKVAFGADGGDLVTVSNFPSAILDLPIASSNSDAQRSFVAFTDRIPPLETRVTLYFRAVEPPAPVPAQPK